MFRRAHPSYYALPLVAIAGYALNFHRLDLGGHIVVGGMVMFFSLVGLSLIIWPK